MDILNFLKLLTNEQIKEIMKASDVWKDDFHNFEYLETDTNLENVIFAFDSLDGKSTEVYFYYCNDSICAATH